MTTIVFCNGVIAADSQLTKSSDEGGDIKRRCQKLFPKRDDHLNNPLIIATAGDSAPGLLFVDWYGTGAEPPEALRDASIECLVLTKDGLYEYDSWCRGERIDEPFYAIGSGAKAALGALHMGADARTAVEIAAHIDPYTSGPFTVLRLEDVK